MSISNLLSILLPLVSCLFTVSLAQAENTVAVQDCSLSNLLTSATVSINPQPAHAGSIVTVSITGNLTTSVDGGTFDVDASLMGVPVFNKSGDLCQMGWFTCPSSTGLQVLLLEMWLPSTLAETSLAIQASLNDTKGNSIMCLEFSILVQRPQENATAPADIQRPDLFSMNFSVDKAHVAPSEDSSSPSTNSANSASKGSESGSAPLIVEQQPTDTTAAPPSPSPRKPHSGKVVLNETPNYAGKFASDDASPSTNTEKKTPSKSAAKPQKPSTSSADQKPANSQSASASKASKKPPAQREPGEDDDVAILPAATLTKEALEQPVHSMSDDLAAADPSQQAAATDADVMSESTAQAQAGSSINPFEGASIFIITEDADGEQHQQRVFFEPAAMPVYAQPALPTLRNTRSAPVTSTKSRSRGTQASASTAARRGSVHSSTSQDDLSQHLSNSLPALPQLLKELSAAAAQRMADSPRGSRGYHAPLFEFAPRADDNDLTSFRGSRVDSPAGFARVVDEAEFNSRPAGMVWPWFQGGDWELEWHKLGDQNENTALSSNGVTDEQEEQVDLDTNQAHQDIHNQQQQGYHWQPFSVAQEHPLYITRGGHDDGNHAVNVLPLLHYR